MATTSRAKSGSSRSSGRTRATARSEASGSSSADNKIPRTRAASSQSGSGQSASRPSTPKPAASATKRAPSSTKRTPSPRRSSSAGGSQASRSAHSAASLADSLPHVTAPSLPRPHLPHLSDGTIRTMGAVGLPIVTAAAGLAGGIVIARVRLRRQRKIFGIPWPVAKAGLSDLSQQVSEAGRQFGVLAAEVRAALEKAEEINRAVGH